MVTVRTCSLWRAGDHTVAASATEQGRGTQSTPRTSLSRRARRLQGAARRTALSGTSCTPACLPARPQQAHDAVESVLHCRRLYHEQTSASLCVFVISQVAMSGRHVRAAWLVQLASSAGARCAGTCCAPAFRPPRELLVRCEECEWYLAGIPSGDKRLGPSENDVKSPQNFLKIM